LPEFAEREVRLAAEKEKRLARAVDAALARKPASDHPPLPSADYEFPAIPRDLADRSGLDDFHAFLDGFAERAAAGGADELHELLDQDLG
jgi:hypothetical protein